MYKRQEYYINVSGPLPFSIEGDISIALLGRERNLSAGVYTIHMTIAVSYTHLTDLTTELRASVQIEFIGASVGCFFF